jgi:hypothetical protein
MLITIANQHRMLGDYVAALLVVVAKVLCGMVVFSG